MKTTEKRPIAVIDSGIGGVSVLRHLMRALPNEDFVYFGDTANVPYGSKTTDEIRDITVKNIEMLLRDYSVKAVVIACNTATGAAAAECREMFDSVPIIGIEPAVKPAVTQSDKENPTVLVMATPLTLSQEKFTSLAQKYNPNAAIIPLPCKGLASLIESGASEDEINALLEKLFESVDKGSVDAIVLGCTHYPLIENNISALFDGVKIFDGGLGTALQTKRRLLELGLLCEDNEEGKLKIINSALDEGFEARAKRYL